MKKISIILFLIINSIGGFSQSISGKIQNSEYKPVPYVNVLLLNNKDSSLVKGASTDDLGIYRIENINSGTYLIAATMVGYKMTYGNRVTIMDDSEVKIPAITLINNVAELKEVTIETTRPFIEQEIDRTVVNVANSIISSGSTALEVLEKAPGVTVDRQNDGIALRGKEGVIVQIDGKQTYLSMPDVVALLKTMPSDNIDKIELITNPSAKFDAQGNSGIINIRMKKNNNVGTNGSISLAGGSGRYDRERGSIQLNHRTRKINFFGNYSVNRGGNYWNFDLKRTQEDGDQLNIVEQDSYIRFKEKGQNAKLGLDYFIGEKTTIGLVWTGFWNSTQEQSPAHAAFRRREGGPVYLQTLTDKTLENINSNHVGNINLQHTFRGKGGLISFDVDFGHFSRDFENNLITSTIISAEPVEGLDGLFTQMPTTIDILTFKADYSRALQEGWKIESGFKNSTVVSDNDMTLSSGKLGEIHLDPALSNHFQYEEQVNAFYSSVSGKISQLVEMQFGIRAEHTHSIAKSINLDTKTTRRYLDFFPSLFLSRDLSKKQNLTFSYSHRIDRPNYQFLNPARSYLDPYGYSRGNPLLQPQYTHAVELKHGFDNKVFTSVGANFIRDLMFFLVQPVDGQKFERTPENIGTSQAYNINISFPVFILKSWTLQTNIMGLYSRQQFRYQGTPINVEQLSSRINGSNSFVFGKGWTAELTGWLNSPARNAIFYSPWRGTLDAGIQKSINSKWKAKLSIQDIFHTNQVIAIGNAPGYSQNINIKFDTRVTMLNLTYTFGNQQLKNTRQRKTGLDDEMNRTN